jgi:beta-lactamase class A
MKRKSFYIRVTIAVVLASAVTPIVAASNARLSAQGAPPLPANGKEDKELRSLIEPLVKAFHGGVGVYVRNLRTGATVSINADDTFPTASMVKVPLLIGLYDQVAKGKLYLDSLYTFNDSTVIQSDDDDVMGKMPLGTRIPLRKVAFMMEAFSDNTASVWIQSLIGGSQVANAWLEQNGYTITRDNSRLAERRAIWRKWGWGMMSPREMASLLVNIRNGKVVSPQASQEMYNLLTHSYWKDDAISGIPPWVQAADKSGWVTASRGETILVNSPAGDYVLCVATKDIQDQSGGYDNEATTMIRHISWIVYHHYNPKDTWRPVWFKQ